MRAWDLLGIEPTRDIRAIKRAYAAKLKTTRPDDDAEAYQQLREAYEWAQYYAKHFAEHEGDDQELAPAAGELPALPPQMQTEPEPDVEVQEGVYHSPTVESLLAECARVWADQGSKGLEQAWPLVCAQLEDLPITQHNHASRAFAQFVAAEPGLPVEMLVALTRHFQWGLDFKVDQLLGQRLSQTLHAQLSMADVYSVFRPEGQTQHAWSLALAKLWDEGRRGWMGVLVACLDGATRQRILQARPHTLNALGASRAAIAATQRSVAAGGWFQGGCFMLMVLGLLALLHRPGDSNAFLTNVAGGALGAGLAYSFLYEMLRNFSGNSRRAPRKLSMIGAVVTPAVIAVLAFLDQQFLFFGGRLESPGFILGLCVTYVCVWFAALTYEDPWHEIFLPTLALLTFGMEEYFPNISFPLLISCTFAWTMSAHVLMRKFPKGLELVYRQFMDKVGRPFLPIVLIATRYIWMVWVWIAVALLPLLLFRMASKYRVLTAGVAIYAGVVLAHARKMWGQPQGLLLWVLGVVICIHLLQALLQYFADYSLAKVRRRA